VSFEEGINQKEKVMSILDRTLEGLPTQKAVLCRTMIHEYGVSENDVLEILRDREVDVEKYINDSIDANAIAMELLFHSED
jgi:hypothetical protein